MLRNINIFLIITLNYLTMLRLLTVNLILLSIRQLLTSSKRLTENKYFFYCRVYRTNNLLANEISYEYAMTNLYYTRHINKYLNEFKCRRSEWPNILKMDVLSCLIFIIYSCLLYSKVFTSKLCVIEILLLPFIKKRFVP